MFAIEIVGSSGGLAGRESFTTGRIVVGAFSENFEMSLTFWSEAEYRGSWHRALRGLEEDACAVSCLVASITDPRTSNFMFCWPLYRKNETVYVQDSVIFLDQFSAEFDPARPWLSILPRVVVDEDGNKISEWATDMSNLRHFLRSGALDE